MADTKKLHNKLNIDGEEYLIQASGASYLDADIELTVKSDTVEWGKTQFGSEANPTAIVDIKGGAATANPLMDGTATPGVANKFAREDHVHPTDTTRAPNDHADASTKYGLAETGKYGHAKSASEMPLTDSTTTKNTGGQIGSQVAVFARADHIHPRHEHLYASSASEGGPADSVKATHKIAYTKATGDNDIPATNNFNKTYNGSAELVVTIPNASGAALTAGFITGKNQKKLDEIADGAEVNQVAYSNVKVGTTDVAATTKTDTLTLVAGDNIELTPSAADKKITISTPSYTADEGVELDGNYNFRAALKAYDDITKKSASFKSTSTNGNRFYPVELDKNADLAVQVPWIDTSVTAVGNHYKPVDNIPASKTASASGGSTMGWNSSVVTGVTLSRDAAGHVTDVSVSSAKIPANPDTNTSHTHDAGIGLVGSGNAGTSGGKYSYKANLRSETALTVDSSAATTTSGRVYPVATDNSGYLAVNVPWTDTSVTSVGNHYKPADNIPASKTASASGGNAMGWSSSVVTGVTLSRDAAGHVTDVAVTSAKIPANPDTNTAHSHGVGDGLTLTGGGGTTGETKYTLKTASTDDIGGVKTGFATNNTNRNYAVQLDANNKAYVNVPWEAEQTADVFYGAGSGITMSTDTQGSRSNPHLFSHADTSSVGNVAATGINVVNAVTFDGYGHVTGFSTRNLPTGDNSTLGVTLLHNADDCTSYTSDSGGAVTPAAVRKAITNFADFQASSSNYGVVKIGYSASGKNYAVQLDSSGKMYVNVPWSNTTYSAGTGLSLSGTTFSVQTGYTTSGKNYAVQAGTGGLYVNVPWSNTTYSAGTGLSLSNTTFSVKTGYTTSGKNYAVVADGSGNLYVNVPWSNTTYSFASGDNQGQLKLGGTNYTAKGLGTSGTPTFSTVSAGTFYASSDKRLKENLREFCVSESILDLPIYTFDFIDGKKDQIGCIAQDLQKICPELVEVNEQTGMLNIQESKLVYLLIEEVRKLKQAIKSN